MITQLTRLISTPPGDLVYHLVVLFATWAIFLLSLSAGRRSRWASHALRVTIASVSLLVVRAVLVIAALVSAAGLAEAAWIMPPLERFAAVVSLGLLAWAFLPWAQDHPQTGLVLVIVNSVGGVVLYALLGTQWYRDAQTSQTFYNAALTDSAWSVWAIVLAALAIVAALTRRRAQWEIAVTAFGLLLLGHVLHLIMPDLQSHVAGWVRLAELCAYPILAGLMQFRAAEQEESPTAVLPAALAASAPWAAIEACQRVAEATNLAVAVQRAGVAMNTVLATDVIAIGLLNKSGDTLDLAAVCRAGAAPRSGPTFDVASQQPLQAALNRKRASMVDVDQETHRATLAALVGGAGGPLWVQPLIHQRVAVGVLIAGRFTQRKTFAWTSSEIEMLNGLCGVLASALSAAQTGAALAQQVDLLQQQARERDMQLAQAEAKAQQIGAQLAQVEAQRKRAPVPIPVRSEPPPDKSEEPGLPPAGEKTLRVRVRLDGNSPLKSARAMMVLAHIKRVGRMVSCSPVEADLRSGGFEDEFTMTFATSSEPSSVRSALTAIRDVIGVDVQAI